jgi:hypothetical protein
MTSRPSKRRLTGAAVLALSVVVPGVFLAGGAAQAAVVPTVALATSARYSVLAGDTVTNTGDSVLGGSLGLSPGTAVTGFPPGLVVPPGTTDVANAAAAQAKSDLTAAYVDAAGRPVDATTTADLANLVLQGGVYSGPSKSPLSLTGPLVLDGAGNADSVFVFQTDSTLITASGSTVTLVNGAQACNVFWQVGSSATLGTGSVFAGNILALTSISVTNGVLVHGRALARNGAVTLDDDTFTDASCAPLSQGTTTTSTTPSSTTTTAATGTTASTGGSETSANPTGAGTTAVTSPATTATATPEEVARRLTRTGLTTQSPAPAGPGVPRVVGPPRTGAAPAASESRPARLAVVLVALLGGGVAVGAARRRDTRVASAGR